MMTGPDRNSALAGQIGNTWDPEGDITWSLGELEVGRKRETVDGRVYL
jgi:hypothetical protein